MPMPVTGTPPDLGLLSRDISETYLQGISASASGAKRKEICGKICMRKDGYRDQPSGGKWLHNLAVCAPWRLLQV